MARGPHAELIGGACSAPLWVAVDDLLERSSLEGILAHRLGPLAAERRRRLGLELLEPLRREERTAAVSCSSAGSLLRRIREICDGPMLALKGPELVRLYPPNGRFFGDLDLLVRDPEAVQRALLAAGFVAEDADVPLRHHHLRPLLWPTSTLRVEVHSRLNWPPGPVVPALDDLLAASVSSSLGIEGVAAPGAAHHAVILAVHAWQHRPLRVLRDLIDVAAASAGTAQAELEQIADAWNVPRIWRTTRGAVEALFYGGGSTPSLRTWARSLEEGRARNGLETDLEALVSGFWWMPPRAALAHAGQLVRRRVVPEPDETWRGQLGGALRRIRGEHASERSPRDLSE